MELLVMPDVTKTELIWHINTDMFINTKYIGQGHKFKSVEKSTGGRGGIWGSLSLSSSIFVFIIIVGIIIAMIMITTELPKNLQIHGNE